MNIGIIVALPNIDDAKKIRGILVRHGYSVNAVSSTGSGVLQSASAMDAGIVVSGYHLKDMYCMELSEYLPSYFELVLLGSRHVISEAPAEMLSIEMPMKVSDLLNTIDMITMQMVKRIKKNNKRKLRTRKDDDDISKAKLLLMERNHLSEEEAYRYIQKNSMDSQTNMAETAQMILMLMHDSA